MRLQAGQSATNQSLGRRLVIGFAALAIAAVVGTVGMASAATKPKATAGYGGGNNNNIGGNINLEVNGSRNVIHIVVNYFFG